MRKIIVPLVFGAFIFLGVASSAFAQGDINSSSGEGVMSAAMVNMRLDFKLDKPIKWQDVKLAPGAYYCRFETGAGGRPIIVIIRPNPGPDAPPPDPKHTKNNEMRVATSMVDEAHKGDQPQLILNQKGQVCKAMLPSSGMRLMFCSLSKKDPGESLPITESYRPVIEP